MNKSMKHLKRMNRKLKQRQEKKPKMEERRIIVFLSDFENRDNNLLIEEYVYSAVSDIKYIGVDMVSLAINHFEKDSFHYLDDYVFNMETLRKINEWSKTVTGDDFSIVIIEDIIHKTTWLEQRRYYEAFFNYMEQTHDPSEFKRELEYITNESEKKLEKFWNLDDYHPSAEMSYEEYLNESYDDRVKYLMAFYSANEKLGVILNEQLLEMIPRVVLDLGK
jgi:hypothetical protein